MKFDDLTDAQVLRYFEHHLKNLRKSGAQYMARCPWHDDRHASLSINIFKKVWNCHGPCKIGGGLIAFEMRIGAKDEQTALSRIGEIIGETQLMLGQQPEAIYPYTDEHGKELFQVVRYPGKEFRQRRRDEHGKWVFKTSDLDMVLYNLPQVVTAKQIAIVEGEKDCDNLASAIAGLEGDKYKHIAVTTSPRGAGKWRDEFSRCFAYKSAAIFPDNDEAGRKHAETVAASLWTHCKKIRIVNLPDLPEKGDVSDFLKTHSAEEVLALAGKAPQWFPGEQSAETLFMTVPQFEEKSSDQLSWLVEGLIQRGANGMIIARPKSGKSWAVLDLAIALASGQRWLDFYVPKRVRTALVSREDFGGLTQWREKKLRAHRKLSAADLDQWLYINAKGLKRKMMLDSPDDVTALVNDLKRYGTEFLILDVMRVLHGSEENDNTEMQKIIDVLNSIQDQTGAAICLVHHDNKREDASLTERARGASAIAGWAEFIAGIRVVDEVNATREFVCELKAAMAPDKFYFRIIDTPDSHVELARIPWTPPARNGRHKKESVGESEDKF